MSWEGHMNNKLLTLCYTLAEKEVVCPVLAYFTQQEYRTFYRRYYPRVVASDIDEYQAIAIINAANWQAARYTLTEEEIKRLAEFVRAGGLLILATSAASDLYPQHRNTFAFNELLQRLGIQMTIFDNSIQDSQNTYAGTIRQMPYQQSVPGHWIHREGYEKLTLGPTNSLAVKRGVDVLLSTYPTAAGGAMPTAAIGKAGNGYLLAINGEAYLSMGIGVISPPLLETKRLAEARKCMGRITAYLCGLQTGEIPWHPNGLRWEEANGQKHPDSHSDSVNELSAETGKWIQPLSDESQPQCVPQSVQVSENHLPPSALFGNITQSGDSSFQSYHPAWRNEVDDAIYGWIQREKIRGGWCYISTGERAYRKRLTQMAKDGKLNLLWGVVNSHLEFSNTPHPGANLFQFAEEIAEDLDALFEENSTHTPRVGWFMGFQFPNMLVDRSTHSHTQQLDGVIRENPSPVDLGYWEEHIFPHARRLATFSLKHPCVRGLLMDLEMYGFPLWFYPDTCDFGDTAFDYFLCQGAPFLSAEQRESAKSLTSTSRFEWLMEEGLLEWYFKVLCKRAEEIGRRLKREIHQINPKLIIGFYLLNIERSWFYRGFLRGISSRQRPVIFLSFNMESHRNLRLLEQDDIYLYHASAALMGKFPLSAYEKVLNDAMINGDGYWLNRITSLVTEGTTGDFSLMESPFELNATGQIRHFETLKEKQNVIERIGIINHEHAKK